MITLVTVLTFFAVVYVQQHYVNFVGFYSNCFFRFGKFFLPNYERKIDVPIDTTKRYLICNHPHGVCVYTATWTGIQRAFAEIFTLDQFKFLIASCLLYIPFYGMHLKCVGCVDASYKNAKYHASNNKNIILFPGGEAEQIRTVYGREKIVVHKSLRFIHLAKECGIDILPVYIFGENSLFKTSDKFFGIRHWIQKQFRIALPLFWGRYGTFIPLDQKVTVVVGKPISCEDKNVETIFQEYKAEYLRIFNKYKKEAGFEDSVLEFEVV